MANTLTSGIAWNRGAVQSSVSVASNTVGVPGIGIQLTATVTGTVTLTWDNDATHVVTVAVGDNIYPYSVKKWVVLSGATITQSYFLY